jgi:hypothetical protein
MPTQILDHVLTSLCFGHKLESLCHQVRSVRRIGENKDPPALYEKAPARAWAGLAQGPRRPRAAL